MTNLYSDVINKSKNDYVLRAKTFITGLDGYNFDYRHRDMESNIHGTIYLHNDDFVLKTDGHQGGCASQAGLFDGSYGGSLQYNVVKHIPAIGIRMVRKKLACIENPAQGKNPATLIVEILFF